MDKLIILIISCFAYMTFGMSAVIIILIAWLFAHGINEDGPLGPL